MPTVIDERAASAAIQPLSAAAGRSADAGSRKVLGLSALFGAMYFIQSVGDPTSGLIAQPVRALLKQWGESATSIAAFMGLLALPWMLKPLLALFADFVPVFGSRRRNPLLLASALSGLGLLVLAWVPVPAGGKVVLFTLLLLPTIGIALGDVLVDALMVEEGQPRGLTGRFQSVQWTAANLALLIAGAIGGYVSEGEAQSRAFLLCAMLWIVSFVLTALYVREPAAARYSPTDWRSHRHDLLNALRVPGLAPACAILFVWSFNPLWQSVLYLHMTETLGFSEQFFGDSLSVFYGGCMAGSAVYAAYCRRARLSTLIHGSIVAGIVSNALYFQMQDERGALLVSAVAGFTFMTGTLIQLDVAARLVPTAVAATMFATIMALTNVAAGASEALGGYLYDVVKSASDEWIAYQGVVVLSAAMAASCWLLMPWLKRDLPAWWNR